MHWQIKGISRSSGRSSVAAIAYRAGEKLLDERTGELYDYTRRVGILETELFLPNQETTVTREKFWNQVEQAEKRKDAQVAREIIVGLPQELNQNQQIELARTYAKELTERTGWAVDMAVHTPGREGDQRNAHAHLLCSTRKIEQGQDGTPILGAKTREWNDPRTSKEMVTNERAEWANTVNKALEREGISETLDPRSYAEQGLEILPTKHLGVHAMALERQGIATELGDYNREVERHNVKVIELAEKRQEREAETQWQHKLEIFKDLPLKELDAIAREYRPKSLEALMHEDLKVREAYKPLHPYVAWDHPNYQAYKAGELGWLNETNRIELGKEQQKADRELERASHRVEQWREAHPIKAKLYEFGLPNREFKDLQEQQRAKEKSLDALDQRLERFDKERSEAQKRLEQTKELARPKAEKEYERQMERYKSLEKVLEHKRALEPEKERERDRGMER